MTARHCLPPPPPRDTVECAPDLDDLAFDDEATSGVHNVIDPERAATMRAEWAALETVVSLPDFAVLPAYSAESNGHEVAVPLAGLTWEAA